MQKWNRRRFLTTGAATGAALLTGAAGTASAATPPTVRPAGEGGSPEDGSSEDEPLEIVTGEDGFTHPAVAPPGPVTFETVSTSMTTGFVGLARLRDGYDEAAFKQLLRTLFSSQVPAETIAATHELMAASRLFGGAAVHPGITSHFTAELEPGRYLLLEYRDFQSDLGRNPPPGQEYVRTLTVREDAAPLVATADAGAGADASGRPHCTATLRALHTRPGPRFVLRGRVRAGRPLRYVNSVPDQPDEAIIYRVADDGVTREDIQAFFDGATRTPPFAIKAPLGTPPLSPGEGVTLTMPTEPGRYVAVSWVGSVEDAKPMAQHGQHLLFRVH
ncbi:hypothetical protein [Streptomyces axinellae]|uniref:Secreted protein n=1 Tax=Streptomyces axinellae TaxID=552788 RepID=A0ABN3PQT6_9ACTN